MNGPTELAGSRLLTVYPDPAVSLPSSKLTLPQVSGLAWAQGRFISLDEPVVLPFLISDYGTECMGAITALPKADPDMAKSDFSNTTSFSSLPVRMTKISSSSKGKDWCRTSSH